MLVLSNIPNSSTLLVFFETSIGIFLWQSILFLVKNIYYSLTILLNIYFFYLVFLLFRGIKSPKRSYDIVTPKKRFLAFVPAHNEESVIAAIVENLMNKMDYPKELYDVFVIADNCTDQTANIARNKGAKVIEHFSAPDEPKGKPYGIKYAIDFLGEELKNYDYVCVFDADNLVAKNYFMEMNAQFVAHPEIKVSQCYIDAKNVDDNIVSLGYALTFYQTNRFFAYARASIGLAPGIGGTGFAVNREVLEEIGWEVNTLTEDLEFQVQCVLQNYKLGWNHFTSIYDEKPTGYKQSMIQRVRWARGNWMVHRRYFLTLIKKIVLEYINKGKINFTLIDTAFYTLTPLLIAISPLFLLIRIFLLPETTLNQILNYLLSIFMVVILAKIAVRKDTKQKINSSYPKMFVSLIWHFLSGSLVYAWGLLTYKNNVWIRTEHNVNLEIEEVLSNINE